MRWQSKVMFLMLFFPMLLVGILFSYLSTNQLVESKKPKQEQPETKSNVKTYDHNLWPEERKRLEAQALEEQEAAAEEDYTVDGNEYYEEEQVEEQPYSEDAEPPKQYNYNQDYQQNSQPAADYVEKSYRPEYENSEQYNRNQEYQHYTQTRPPELEEIPKEEFRSY